MEYKNNMLLLSRQYHSAKDALSADEFKDLKRILKGYMKETVDIERISSDFNFDAIELVMNGLIKPELKDLLALNLVLCSVLSCKIPGYDMIKVLNMYRS